MTESLPILFRRIVLIPAAIIAILIFVDVCRAQTVPTNEYCPVLTTEKVDPAIFVDYQGKRVHFCCTKCRRDFLANPATYLANLPQFAGSSADSKSMARMSSDTSMKMSGDDAAATATEKRKAEPAAIRLAGKLHPVVVHFPIALVITSAFFSLQAIVRRKPSYNQVSYRLMYLAALSAVVTALFGLAAGAGSSWPEQLAGYFSWHRIFGLTAGLWTILSALIGFVAERGGSHGVKRLYYAMLSINVIIIGVTGHLGATLVYGPDHFKL